MPYWHTWCHQQTVFLPTVRGHRAGLPRWRRLSAPRPREPGAEGHPPPGPWEGSGDSRGCRTQAQAAPLRPRAAASVCLDRVAGPRRVHLEPPAPPAEPDSSRPSRPPRAVAGLWSGACSPCSERAHTCSLPHSVECAPVCDPGPARPWPGVLAASRGSVGDGCTCRVAATDRLRGSDSCEAGSATCCPQTRVPRASCSASRCHPLLSSPLQQPGCGHASRKSRSERSPPPVRGIDKQRAAGSPSALIHQSWRARNTSRLASHGRNVFAVTWPASGYPSGLANTAGPGQQKCRPVRRRQRQRSQEGLKVRGEARVTGSHLEMPPGAGRARGAWEGAVRASAART